MITLIAGSLVLSVLHALIPNHWLPIIAIGRKENWSLAQVTRITLLAGLAHAASTVLIGMILTAVDLLKRNPSPSEAEIRKGIEGNLCRCTGYHNIVKSIQYAAERMR